MFLATFSSFCCSKRPFFFQGFGRIFTPVTRLVRRTESHIAARTKVHWAVFRKVLSDDLGELVESQHWDTVTEYIMAAWEVVTMTPV